MGSLWKVVVFTKQLWRWYAVAAVLVVIGSLLSLATPLISKEVVDQVVAQIQHGGGDQPLILWLMAAMLAIQVLQLIIQSVGGWVGDLIEVKLRMFLSATFFAKVLSLDVAFFDNNDSGRTINKFNRGISQITGFIQGLLNNFLPMVLTAVFTIGLLAFYSWPLAVLLAALFPVYIFISQKSTEDWKVYEDQKNSLSDNANSRAYEAIAGIRVVKSFAGEVAELLGFKQNNDRIEQLTSRQSKGWHGYDLARQFVLNGVLFASFVYIIYYTYHGTYSIGEMTLLLQLVQQARMPLFAMSYILGQVQRVDAGSKDYFAIIATPVVVADPPEGRPLTIAKPSGWSIAFEEVSFAYDEVNPVLEGVTLTIKAKQKFALVGESGQGKSTLVNLLLRFYQPQLGQISIAGQDISQISQASLREQIAVVFQEAWLFSGSVADNIAYGNPGASRAEIEAAAKAANADEFISQLPQGYDSLVGERGVKLSGGQKQRISIARAILKDAPIIVLDEATSALDSKSELLVQEGLDRLMAGRTSIIIAHRLSTIAQSDQIAVIGRGTVLEAGSPEDLLKKPNGQYAALMNLQQKLMGASKQAKKKALSQFDLVG